MLRFKLPDAVVERHGDALRGYDWARFRSASGPALFPDVPMLDTVAFTLTAEVRGSDMVVIPADAGSALRLRRYAETLDHPITPGVMSTQGLARLDRTLTAAVADINKGQPTMSMTGAPALAGAFREQLAGIKAEIADAHTQVGSAMDELRDTARQAKDAAKAIRAESADLKAALGLVSNNPPAET